MSIDVGQCGCLQAEPVVPAHEVQKSASCEYLVKVSLLFSARRSSRWAAGGWRAVLIKGAFSALAGW
jgi:hypothetical protein